MEYNLQVLQSMLECNCDADNKINKSTFLHIIRKWVNDVRDRCVPPPSPARASLEVRPIGVAYVLYRLGGEE